MTIQEAIRKLADKGDEVYSKVCKVTSVDTTKRTCDVEPLDGSAAIFDVRLQASQSATEGFLMVPASGSFVVVNFLNKNVAVIGLCTELDYMYLRGDSLGGLIKIEELKTQLAKTNKLVDAIRDLLMTWAVVAQDGGQALKTTAIANLQGLSTGNFSNIENTKVKHG